MSTQLRTLMDSHLKDRPRYKLRHIYELLEVITGKNRKAIRKKMARMKLNYTDENFTQYLEYFFRKKFKEESMPQKNKQKGEAKKIAPPHHLEINSNAVTPEFKYDLKKIFMDPE